MKKFDISHRGYNKDQVDKYIIELEHKYSSTLREQKDRIFTLVDEVSRINDELKQYKMDEQAISKSLVESQKLASELRFDADRYSQLTLSRAKVFHATWQTYAKTLLATLTDSEVKQFNALSDKIAMVINTCQDNGDFGIAPTVVDKANTTVQDANPIVRVQNISQHSIDPKEILNNDIDLVSVCKELGLVSN